MKFNLTSVLALSVVLGLMACDKKPEEKAQEEAAKVEGVPLITSTTASSKLS